MSTALLPHQQRNLEHWLSCRQWPLRVACDLLTGSIPAPETWGEEASSQAADRALGVVWSAIRAGEIRDEDLELSNEFREGERVYYISPRAIWTWAQCEPWYLPHSLVAEYLADKLSPLHLSRHLADEGCDKLSQETRLHPPPTK